MQLSEISVKTRLAKITDLSNVQELLQKENLPIERIEDQFTNFTLLFDQNSNLIGCAGLEIYNNYGLIRSVAIKSEFQNKKLGSYLIKEIEDFAKRKKLTNLYLLTETAEKFFSKHGYTIISRDTVPLEIQNSFEYTSSCKISALVMKKVF